MVQFVNTVVGFLRGGGDAVGFWLWVGHYLDLLWMIGFAMV